METVNKSFDHGGELNTILSWHVFVYNSFIGHSIYIMACGG